MNTRLWGWQQSLRSRLARADAAIRSDGNVVIGQYRVMSSNIHTLVGVPMSTLNGFESGGYWIAN
jgi:hypothetical protein